MALNLSSQRAVGFQLGQELLVTHGLFFRSAGKRGEVFLVFPQQRTASLTIFAIERFAVAALRRSGW